MHKLLRKGHMPFESGVTRRSQQLMVAAIQTRNHVFPGTYAKGS